MANPNMALMHMRLVVQSTIVSLLYSLPLLLSPFLSLYAASPSSFISQSGTRPLDLTTSALLSFEMQTKLWSTQTSVLDIIHSKQRATGRVSPSSSQHQSLVTLPRATPTAVPSPTEEPAILTLDGSSLNISIPSGSFENLQFNVKERSTLELQLGYAANETQRLAVYGRNGAQPTLTQYDFTEALNSDDRL
jgi:ATPase subunit of ABC transporter with duplicated ATPase domains